MKNNNNTDNPTLDDLTAKTQDLHPSADKPAGWTESSSDWVAPPRTTDAPQTAAPLALQARDITVRYGAKQVLTDITFNLKEGDVLGLLGLNGAGKSTLIKVLSGAMAPNQGTVHIGDHELFAETITPRMDIGYAPDKPAIYPEFCVTEFLHFIARTRRIEKRRIKPCIDNVIERCALGDVRKRIIGNLSTGYQQRVNIAQALIHRPKILILDEPANGLDPVQLMEMRVLINTLESQQATIFSSHLLSEVDAVCNRILLINEGRQVLNAPMESLTDKHNNSFKITLNTGNEFNLTELPGVTHACKISDNEWLTTGQSITAEQLQTMLLSRGHPVTQIQRADNYLESLFQYLASVKPDNPTAVQPHRGIEK